MARAGVTYTLDVAGIPVQVTHKDVKNVNCRVGRDGTARMSVPRRMSREQVRQVALRHADWFARSQQRVEQKTSNSLCSWETGSTLMVWGEPKTLRIVPLDESKKRAHCELLGDELVIHVDQPNNTTEVALVAEQWLKEQLRVRVQSLLPACQERVGRSATSITLRRMKSRWGSCTTRTGRIRLNIALAECPPDCTEMVLVHELCHLVEANHGPRFYALMDLNFPGWRACDRWLNEHPPRANQ